MRAGEQARLGEVAPDRDLQKSYGDYDLVRHEDDHITYKRQKVDAPLYDDGEHHQEIQAIKSPRKDSWLIRKMVIHEDKGGVKQKNLFQNIDHDDLEYWLDRAIKKELD